MGKKKVPVSGKKSVYTYALLRGMAWNAYETAEEQESGRYLHCMSAVVFCAFTLEGYLNRIGVRRMRHWDILERKLLWHEKLELIGREFNTKFDKGKRPFQSMAETLKFRDRLAHGKSVIDEEFSGQHSLGDVQDSYLHPEWRKKYSSLTKVKAVLKDMDSALCQLRSSAGLGSLPVACSLSVSWVSRVAWSRGQC
jgi:hypothetical protein